MLEDQNNIIVIPDVHCRSFYKPVLQIKNRPVVFLGDYMDPYSWEGFSDEEGIEKLKEIINFARNNKNVTLLAGNHDEELIWSYMGFSRTKAKFYPKLHKIYRDNIDLFHPIHKISNTIFTHAGINSGWVDTMNDIFKREKKHFQLTEKTIISYIENEWNLELKNDVAPNQHFMYSSLNSEIFCIGRSRGGYAPYGGPFWSDFNDDYADPKEFSWYQVFGHTQGFITGFARRCGRGTCLDSRAIFEYNVVTHEAKFSDLNTDETKEMLGKTSY